VTLIEVEPADDGWGEPLSVEGQGALDSAVAMARREVARVLEQ
jgi:hypothetical protein